MSEKKNEVGRYYSSGMMTVLNHPMRIALYDLIREGAKSAPEMAAILDENRVNLYHHLGKLEKEGLIEGYYSDDRVKKFRLVLPSEKTDVNPENYTNIQAREGEEDRENLATSNVIMIAPPSDRRTLRKFKKNVKSILETSKYNLSDDLEIIQVQVILQPKDIAEKKQKKIEEILKKEGKK